MFYPKSIIAFNVFYALIKGGSFAIRRPTNINQRTKCAEPTPKKAMIKPSAGKLEIFEVNAVLSISCKKKCEFIHKKLKTDDIIWERK